MRIIVFLAFMFLSSCSEDSNDGPEPEFIEVENISVVDTHYFKAELDGLDFYLEHIVYDNYPQLEENYHENHYFWHVAHAITNRTIRETIDGRENEYCYDSYYSSSIAYDPYTIGNSEEYDGIQVSFNELSFGECLVENEFAAIVGFLEKDSFEFTRNYTVYEEYSPLNSIEINYYPANTTDTFYTSSSGDNTDAEFKITSFNYDTVGTYGLDNISPGSSTEIDHKYEFEVFGEVTCKLYKLYDDSEFVQLKNGRFKMIFITYF